MTEAAMWEAMRPKMAWGRRLTDRTRGGVPDTAVVPYPYDRLTWCELKAPDGDQETLGVRGDQALWLCTCGKAGGLSTVLARWKGKRKHCSILIDVGTLTNAVGIAACSTLLVSASWKEARDGVSLPVGTLWWDGRLGWAAWVEEKLHELASPFSRRYSEPPHARA